MVENFPNDPDGNVLRALANHGNDLSRPMDIDFTVYAADKRAAAIVGEIGAEHGYRVKVVYDKESGSWSVYCTKSMIATYQSVVAAQEEINCFSHPFGGYCDGWGSFGNKKNA